MEVIINNRRYLPVRESTQHKRKLSELVREARQRKGETLRTAADGIGIAYAYLQGMESGRHPNPPFATVVKLAVYYGFDLDDIAMEGEQ